jgi:hypothetical protein
VRQRRPTLEKTGVKEEKVNQWLKQWKNGGHIDWTKHLESDQNLAGFRS